MTTPQAPSSLGTVVEWLAYIESIHPASIDMGLSRVKAVGEALGVLNHHYPCQIVTVAGTNGKGTTVKTLSTLLHTLGFNVGAYTSPHLMHFSERVDINLQPVSDNRWIEAFCAVEQARIQLNQTLTYFEFTTLAAFWIFKSQPLDVLVLEIGLGGRLDAVNIIDPDISIITSIGLDHMDYLGDSLDKIAEEKAGIMRSNKPAIIGLGASRPHLLDIAKQIKAQVYVRKRDFDDVEIKGEGKEINQLFPESVQLAVQALTLLAPKLGLESDKLKQVCDNFPPILLTARFQRLLLDKVEWIVDVAHNTHAVSWLLEQLNGLPSVAVTHIVWCSFIDKDLEGILSTFLNDLLPSIREKTRWYLGPLAHPRTASQPKLAELNQRFISGTTTSAEVCETFEQALNQAYNQAKPSERVVVFGSFQAAHEAFALMKKVKK